LPTEDKTERILKTAVRLFGKEGYYGTRMSEVARQAKVSPKTLYKCYSGKKSLFMASRDAAMDRLVREILSGAPPPGDPDSLAVIKAMLKSYSEFIRRNRGLARILAEAVAVVDDDIRAEQIDAFSSGVTAIGLMIEADVEGGRLRLVADPEKTALLFLSFAALLAYAVLLELDRKSGGGFDPAYALDMFFDVMRAD
jgi:TetR/AcrR family fatty acid metabolism transcriptional regulator